jgi:KDO2-lipid IV(A) lauroyltransferase
MFDNAILAPLSELYYYVLLLGVKILSLIPFRILYVLSDALYYPFYYIIRYRRRIVRKNLTECFPEKSQAEIIRIEKDFYHFFVDMTFESFKQFSIKPEELGRRVKFTNLSLANDKLTAGRSISIFLGHYGNWEWTTSLGLWLYKETVVAQIYRKLRNQTMDRIMKKLRERTGNTCVDMRKTVRYMADAAHDGHPHLIGFIADQSPKRRDAKYFIPFLNHQVPVLTGTEKATKHFDYEAMFLRVKRVKRGYYECEFVPLHDHPQEAPDFELTQRYFQLLEEEIRQHPELYLWTHNRFKYAVYADN